jgi:SagB-type dehydrogenase family enzyme
VKGSTLRRQTVSQLPWLYGRDGEPALDDPAESYHEASKAYPSFVGFDVAGSRRLEQSVELQESSGRSTKRNPYAPAVALPAVGLPDLPFSATVARRRSERSFGADPIALEALAAVLHAAYGLTHRLEGDGRPLRAVPSGGALYPLDLYVVPRLVSGLEEGLYHFDPFRRCLEVLRLGPSTKQLARSSTYPELVEPAAVVIALTGTFWRSRFKYGPRSYRFTLLEAGHVAQNALLTVAALGLAAVPLGGFYDRRVDELLGLDGVNESVLYLLSIGPLPGG